MTLLEMIKKYEKDKAELIAESGSRPTGALAIVNQILKDLRSVEAHPPVTTICDEILKKIAVALDENAPDEALTWARTLQTLPD